MPVSMKPLGDFLIEDRVVVPVEPTGTYRTAGVYSFGRGMFWRPVIDGAATSYRQYVRIRYNDFVFSKLFAWEGALGVVERRFDGALVSAEFPSFRIDDSSLDPGYLAFVVRRPEFYKSLAVNGMGDRRQRVNVGTMLSAKLPWLPVPEQKRIAAYLQNCQQISNEIAARRDRSLHIGRSALDSLVLTTDSREDYAVRDLLTLDMTRVSVEPKKIYREIGLRSFGRGLFLKNPVEGSDLGNKRVFRVKADRLMMSIVFAWEGAVAISGEKHSGMIGSHRFLSFVVNKELVDMRYLRRWLLTEPGLSLLRGVSPGSAGRNRTLSIADLNKCQVALPSLPEQKSIADRIERLELAQENSRVMGTVSSALMESALNQVFGSMS